jgi:hypothetical protein
MRASEGHSVSAESEVGSNRCHAFGAGFVQLSIERASSGGRGVYEREGNCKAMGTHE